MPELPEVETVRRGLAPVMENAVLEKVEQRRADLRFPFPERFADRLTGQTILSLSRRAKYLLADLADETVLIMHLGMSGSFRIDLEEEGTLPGEFALPRGKDPKHDHVVFHLRQPDGRLALVTYNDPRRFGLMTLSTRGGLSEHPLFANLGLEPLGNELDGERLNQLFARKKTPLKAALLDQRLIAGLGNIYVCEALWRAGLSPTRAAGTLSGNSKAAQAHRNDLASAIRSVLEEAIAAGGSTLKDYTHADGSLGYFQHSFAAYGREGLACRTPGCKGVISRITQSGRSTFYCPCCQK